MVVREVEPRQVVVDAATRTYWRPGDRQTETLVEAGADARRAGLGRRVAALLASRGRTPRRAPGAGPQDPALVEQSLVELLRARRFDRAFALVDPDCREAWGSVSRFAAAHEEAARRLLGAEVVAVRRLPVWDEGGGRTRRDVAELVVDYRLAGGGAARRVRRTIHLVRAEGGWRSLLLPPAAP